MTAPERTRVFVVRPATSNIGNELIALGIHGLLRQAWPGGVDLVSLPSAGAGRGGKSTGLTRHSVFDANQLADAVLIGGGNVFENGALEVEQTAIEALVPPMGILAASSGRIYGRDRELHARTDGVPRGRIAALGHRANPLLVRDDATAALFAELGLEHVAIGGCPTVLLDRYADPLPDPAADLAGTALLSIRNPQLMSIPYADQGRVAGEVVKLVKLLGSAYERVELLCHDFRDLEFAATMPEVQARYTEDPLEFLSWIAGAAVQLGYRLHGFLTAVALGTPTVHISYDERGESMIRTLGLEAYEVQLMRCENVATEAFDRLGVHHDRPPQIEAKPAIASMDEALRSGVATLAARANRSATPTLPVR